MYSNWKLCPHNNGIFSATNKQKEEQLIIELLKTRNTMIITVNHYTNYTNIDKNSWKIYRTYSVIHVQMHRFVAANQKGRPCDRPCYIDRYANQLLT